MRYRKRVIEFFSFNLKITEIIKMIETNQYNRLNNKRRSVAVKNIEYAQ